jgi:cell wall-associated NlpC family hydrolase
MTPRRARHAWTTVISPAAISTAAICAASLCGTPLAGQGIDGQIGRFYEDGTWDLYRVGVNRRLTGPIGLGLQGNYFQRAGGGEGRFAGLSADLTAFRGDGQGPYLVAGVGAGMGSPHSNELSSLWGSWSAGVGYQLLPLSFISFGGEARWRQLSLDNRSGVEIAAGMSIRFGGGGGRPESPPGSRSPAAPGTIAPDAVAPDAVAPEAAADVPVGSPGAYPGPAAQPAGAGALREAVIATATGAMGRPYEWGGTGANGGGFDCSGLIQHAYARHGIALPRTSREQAKEGRAVSRELGSLAPGDLLTFSNTGGRVTHVGLYIGDGKFIHSASRGVLVSVLNGEDPYGRWWFERWVGVRRIIEN